MQVRCLLKFYLLKEISKQVMVNYIINEILTLFSSILSINSVMALCCAVYGSCYACCFNITLIHTNN